MFILDKIKAKYPTGSYGGQCVIFCRIILPDLPYGLFGKTIKKAILSRSKGFIPKEGYKPQLGDMIVTDEGMWGHVAIINKVISKNRVRVSESNYDLLEKVSHNRVVGLGSTQLAYIWRSNLIKNSMDKNLQNRLKFIERTMKSLYKYCVKEKSGQEFLDYAHHSAEGVRKLMG